MAVFGLVHSETEIDAELAQLGDYVGALDQEVLSVQYALPVNFVSDWQSFDREVNDWINNVESSWWSHYQGSTYDQAAIYLATAAEYKKKFNDAAPAGAKSELPDNPGAPPGPDWNTLALYGLIGLGLIVLIEGIGAVKEIA